MVPCGNIFHLEAATESHYIEMDRNERLIVEKKGQVLFETHFAHNRRVIISTEHFIECIREGKAPMNTGEDGRAAVELALAALESGRTHAPVHLPLAST